MVTSYKNSMCSLLLMNTESYLPYVFVAQIYCSFIFALFIVIYIGLKAK